MSSASTPARLSMSQVLLCGALIVTLSMGIRHGFGLWLAPITGDLAAKIEDAFGSVEDFKAKLTDRVAVAAFDRDFQPLWTFEEDRNTPAQRTAA